jgi:high-affinity iron transporter
MLVAIIFAYLKKTGRRDLIPTVYVGIVAAILLSLGLGYVLMSVANQALWEGVLAIVAVVMVGSLVVHMWRVGPQLKGQMEKQLAQVSEKSTFAAMAGVFIFTMLMMAREGMETALMLYQVKNQPFIVGSFLGLGFAALVAWMWTKFSHLVNVKRFFQVTGVFLLIFMAQIIVYGFHELCEAGVFPQSDMWHAATEPYSPDGMYGKWFSFISVATIGMWLMSAAVMQQINKRKN